MNPAAGTVSAPTVMSLSTSPSLDSGMRGEQNEGAESAMRRDDVSGDDGVGGGQASNGSRRGQCQDEQ